MVKSNVSFKKKNKSEYDADNTVLYVAAKFKT